MKKRRRGRVIVLALLLILMLIPVRTAYNDGGTMGYEAILWQVEQLHRIADTDRGQGFLVGTRVTLLCGLITVYDDTTVVP